MTKAEKKERRAIRHKPQEAVFQHHFSRMYKMTHTVAQQRADSRKVADQLIAGKNPVYIQLT